MHALLISALWETLKLTLALTALLLAAMCYRRTRRVSFALLRFTLRYAPKWALPVLTACAFFPGQADELIVAAIILIPVLRHARNRRVLRRYVAVAWKD
jgi:hypothetical protein